MKDKLILKNETAIELEAGASLGGLQVLSPNMTAMVTTWGQLTPENLSTVQVQSGEGLTVGRYSDLILISETSVIQADGSILTTYSLREKTAEEKRLDALEAGQEVLTQGQNVQDGAIVELAGMVGGEA